MNSSLIQEAKRLNNEGIVLLLLENREQEAMTCLKKSLLMFKHLPAIARDDKRSSSNPCNMALNVQLLAHSLPNLQGSNGFICCSLLAFSVAEASETLPSKDTIQVCSAIIILNVALAHHRKGMSGNKASVAWAGKMYGMVTKLLSGCENNKGVAVVAKLAAMNNLSVLQHSQGDNNLSQRGFQYLRDLLITVASENLEGSSLLYSTQMYQGMLLNILCVAPPDAAPSA
jgi:hypothetical protein